MRPFVTQVCRQLWGFLAAMAFPSRALYVGQRCSLRYTGVDPAIPRSDVFSRIFFVVPSSLSRAAQELNFMTMFDTFLSLVGTQWATSVSAGDSATQTFVASAATVFSVDLGMPFNSRLALWLYC